MVSQRLQAHTRARDYEVVVGNGCLATLGEEWRRCAPPGQVVVCTDENVAPLYLDQVAASLGEAGFNVSNIVIPAGERQKNLGRVEELYGVLYDRHLSRADTLVALGGGVIGDLVGYIAATYLRGMHFVQVPTTLLAQVDASLGGKVGVDFRAGKNHIGSFYQPGLVVADLETLRTLPLRELRSGWAEVVKHAFIAGGELLQLVESSVATGTSGDTPGSAPVSVPVVAGCQQLKLDVVSRDEREENGERAVLNLGHTIGHAIEAAAGFSGYAHGESVGLGLRATLWLSQRLTGLSAAADERGQRLLSALGLPERLEVVAPAAVLDLIRRDKKRDATGVAYVLLEDLGRVRRPVFVPEDLEREVVEWLAAR